MNNRRNFLLSILGVSAFTQVSGFNTHEVSEDEEKYLGFPGVKLDVPKSWERAGLIIQRSFEGPGSSVVGDPCIVWDEEIKGWRMFLFYDPPGCGHAICPLGAYPGPGHWKLEGAIQFTNPDALIGSSTHKPFIVMNAHEPNKAAKIKGLYYLLTVSFKDGHKVVQESTSEKLSGPWTVISGALISNGEGNEFDAKHADAVTGFYFPERDEVLYYYMGYPQNPQSRTNSPLGNAQGVAVRKAGEITPKKLGEILPPSQIPRHWAGGWVGGLQLLPGKKHRWIAVVNASPTAPQPGTTDVFREEPPPSLGGFAYTDELWPVKGWHFYDKPVEYIEDIPLQATALGEGTNLWRHHILILPGGKMGLYYNSGYYGKEQLYMKISG